ncbi:MAG: CvpA family protein, partial [Lachnospiraceae bacterium]|nr:CvpA family protein [Lachnospiraceae bacterium]
MKKGLRNLIIAVVLLIVAGVYYYVTLPALNIHSAGCWFFVMSLIVIVMAAYALSNARKEQAFG